MMMNQYKRNYVTLRCDCHAGYQLDFSPSDPYDEEIVQLDQILHRTLNKVFHEDYGTSDKIKEILCSPKPDDQNSIINRILQLEPDLGKIFPDGKKLSLLWTSVLMCCQKSAELLVRSGADVNEHLGMSLRQRNHNATYYFLENTTLIHGLLKMYPSSWNERLIKLLVTEYDADLNTRGLRGCTVLHAAVGKNRLKETTMFLDRGLNVNDIQNTGETPLLIAASSSVSDELLQLLLERGADVNARDVKGMNALHHLASASSRQPIEHTCNQARILINKGVSLGVTATDHYQPIHLAVNRRKIALVELFLKHGANVNARGSRGSFPLYLAARYTNTTQYNMMETLLKHGADIDMKTLNKGRTTLHNACKHFNEDNIKILLRYGADMYLEDNRGNTPFCQINIADYSNASIRPMLRMLALETACMQPSIALKDEERIREHPELWNYYQDCIEQVRKANSKMFIGTCTILDLLTKCQCEIAALMRNHEFENILEQHDLDNVFPEYSDAIRKNVDFVEQQYYRPLLELKGKIEETIYNSLASHTVRRVAHYMFDCSHCKIRQIVRASRGSGGN